MSQPKKRKFSGLGGLELELAYNTVSRLKETFSNVESEVNPEGASVPNDDFDQRVLEIFAIFKARVKVPHCVTKRIFIDSLPEVSFLLRCGQR